jgi:RNA polymerase sigma-70 factor (ECF subfamily)
LRFRVTRILPVGFRASLARRHGKVYGKEEQFTRKALMEPETPTAEPTPSPEEIVRDYAPRVYNLARRMLGNDADAEDVTQEALMQAIRKLDTFRGESAFPTWLHRIAVNAALAHRRKRAVREEHRVPEPKDGYADNGEPVPVRRWSVQPDQAMLDRETHELIEEAICNLPEGYRDVYVLADVEGLTNPEIASFLDMSVPAVKSRLHRARLMMRQALAPHFEETAA